jgi:hypothetical protein
MQAPPAMVGGVRGTAQACTVVHRYRRVPALPGADIYAQQVHAVWLSEPKRTVPGRWRRGAGGTPLDARGVQVVRSLGRRRGLPKHAGGWNSGGLHAEGPLGGCARRLDEESSSRRGHQTAGGLLSSIRSFPATLPFGMRRGSVVAGSKVLSGSSIAVLAEAS